MRVRSRTNVWLGLVFAGVTVALLLRVLDMFPEGLDDLILRVWPVLLVFVGLMLLLRERLPLGTIVALLLSGGLVVGLASYAYSSREDEPRTDQEVAMNEAVGEETALLVVNIETLGTNLDLRTATGDSNEIEMEFLGSLASEISFACVQGEVTECTFVEEKPEQFPLLESVGRSNLSLRVPDNVPIALAFAGENGNATFDLSSAQLERIVVDLAAGDVLLTVPAYQPQSPSAVEEPGIINVYDGDLTVLVPPSVNARLVFDRRGSSIDPMFHTDYIEQRDGVDGVLRRDTESGDINLEYDIVIPNGLLQLGISTG